MASAWRRPSRRRREGGPEEALEPAARGPEEALESAARGRTGGVGAGGARTGGGVPWAATSRAAALGWGGERARVRASDEIGRASCRERV